jgi:hypothetical protein
MTLIQLPTLTPHAMIVGRPNLIPESAELDENDGDLRKRAKYLQRCKNAWWSRWSAEYLKALRERHNLKNKTTEMNVKPGDVVLIKGDERNRGRWKIGIVDKLIKGRDGIVRTVRLRAGKSFLERAIQQLYIISTISYLATRIILKKYGNETYAFSTTACF